MKTGLLIAQQQLAGKDAVADPIARTIGPERIGTSPELSLPLPQVPIAEPPITPPSEPIQTATGRVPRGQYDFCDKCAPMIWDQVAASSYAYLVIASRKGENPPIDPFTNTALELVERAIGANKNKVKGCPACFLAKRTGRSAFAEIMRALGRTHNRCKQLGLAERPS